MYTARHSGWLGPSRYIQAYPKISTKPGWRTRLLAWRRFFTYVSILLLAPILAVYIVNLYASSLAVPASNMTGIQEPVPGPSQAGPPVSGSATLSIATLPSAEPVPDAALKELLNSWAAKHPDQKWAVVVQGLGKEKRFAKLNPDDSFRSASLYKLHIMYPLLQKHPYGGWSSIDTPAGNLSDCVTRMLKLSDNSCGEAVGTYLNWSKSTVKLKDLGLNSTNLNDKAGPTSTAGDMATFMSELYSGDKFSPEGRDYILSTLRNQTWRKGIPTGCSGCRVANKTGDLGFVRHDAAIVEYAGRAYVLTVFTSGASYSQIAQLTSQVHTYMSRPYSP